MITAPAACLVTFSLSTARLLGDGDRTEGVALAVPAEHDELVGDGDGDLSGFGKRPRIGFVLERAVAVESQFGDRVVGER